LSPKTLPTAAPTPKDVPSNLGCAFLFAFIFFGFPVSGIL
jgi:hypothetical protein